MDLLEVVIVLEIIENPVGWVGFEVEEFSSTDITQCSTINPIHQYQTVD